MNGFSAEDRAINGNGNQQAIESGMSTAFPNGISLPDIPLPTPNGGYSHTVASRAKISAANKGKTPWNKGKARSKEDRARIAAGVRAKNRERLVEKLKSMGLTEEEYEQQKKEEKRKREAERRARRTPKGGLIPTDETRAKISKALKERHAKGGVKKRVIDPSKVRRGFKQSEETRRKISETLKKRWRDDDDYRDTMVKSCTEANSKAETRKKISETMKRRWQDPDFRENMVQAIGSRNTPSVSYDSSYRQKISDAMKRKWQDPEYRSKTVNSIQRAAKSRPTRSKVKGSATQKPKTKEDDEPQLMIPLSAEDAVKRQKKRAKKKKKKSPALTAAASNKEVAVEPLKAPRKAKVKGVNRALASEPVTNGEITEAAGQEETPKQMKKKRKAKKAKKKKEKDGSVTRLREERRDLFDLLYGDDPDVVAGTDGENVADDNADDVSNMGMVFGDEDLDSFDPYGLDDY
ncbi:MAG: hypothetical protein SGILL_008174 [Bacillariaceae sp.]